MGMLDGKVAVVAGSTRGIGLAIAEAYTREGAKLVISSRSQAIVDKRMNHLQDVFECIFVLNSETIVSIPPIQEFPMPRVYLN